MLDTKGPEIRTAMLRGGKAIALEAGQRVIIEAVGDRYTEYEGFKTAEETRIGLSYPKLCQSVSVGNQILLADGSITIRVDEVLSATEVQGTVLNSKELGQRKNCCLPGVHVDLPVLAPKDIDDVQNFACKHGMDFIAVSFVQSKEDVTFVRSTLDAGGGRRIGIISKIENLAGLQNIDGRSFPPHSTAMNLLLCFC
jgi:pyruvate kinase